MSHAAGSRPDLPGASWPGPDTAYFGSALIRGPMSTPSTSGLDLTVDVGAGQLDAAPHGLAQVDTAEPGAGHFDGAELRAAEVNALNREPCKSV